METTPVGVTLPLTQAFLQLREVCCHSFCYTDPASASEVVARQYDYSRCACLERHITILF